MPGVSSIKCHHGPTNTFTVATPVGDLELISCPKGIHSLNYMGDKPDEEFAPDKSLTVQLKEQLYQDNGYTYKPALKCVDWLQLYFSGAHQVQDLPLPPICFLTSEANKSSTFTERVWRTLASDVGLGRTVSYGDLARLAGSPKASQAVGQAMRNNPVCILVPCHRVVLSSGKVGNYSGGCRNSIKHWLLKHENAAI